MRWHNHKSEIRNQKCAMFALAAFILIVSRAAAAELSLPPEFTRPAPIAVADAA